MSTQLKQLYWQLNSDLCHASFPDTVMRLAKVMMQYCAACGLATHSMHVLVPFRARQCCVKGVVACCELTLLHMRSLSW